jgi:hypothetical protein
MIDMAVQMTYAVAEADLDAFFRFRDDGPAACRSALVTSLAQLRGSDDPVVTFAGLPRACVPGFADGCQVELSADGDLPFRATSPDEGSGPPAGSLVGPEQTFCIPVQAPSRTGYPSYAGMVTYWWTSRIPSEQDVAIADLMVRNVIALVDHERLMAAVGRAEDRAAGLALGAISGRTISLATGIVMRQHAINADEAEDLLRQLARTSGRGLHQVAASVVRSGALPEPVPGRARPAATVKRLHIAD